MVYIEGRELAQSNSTLLTFGILSSNVLKISFTLFKQQCFNEGLFLVLIAP